MTDQQAHTFTVVMWSAHHVNYAGWYNFTQASGNGKPESWKLKQEMVVKRLLVQLYYASGVSIREDAARLLARDNID